MSHLCTRIFHGTGAVCCPSRKWRPISADISWRWGLPTSWPDTHSHMYCICTPAWEDEADLQHWALLPHYHNTIHGHRLPIKRSHKNVSVSLQSVDFTWVKACLHDSINRTGPGTRTCYKKGILEGSPQSLLSYQFGVEAQIPHW